MKVIETFNGVSDFRIYLATGGYYYEAINQELADRGVALADNVVIVEYIHEMAKISGGFRSGHKQERGAYSG